jgi:hypothetical protein
VESIIAKKGSYREILGLGLTFKAQEVSSSARKIYRLVHPDKTPPFLRDRATAVFDAVRKAETEATQTLERKTKVKPQPVTDLKYSMDKGIVSVRWRSDQGNSCARADRFLLSAAIKGLCVDQGECSVAAADNLGWFEVSLSSQSRKGNDVLFAAAGFYFSVTPSNEAGTGPEQKIYVLLRDEEEKRRPFGLPSFGGFLRRHNTSSF